MLTPVSEARSLVLANARPLPVVTCPLEDCLGRRLAQDVRAGEDQPPFDKALVDGFAVRIEDLATLPAALNLGETILAGRGPSRPLRPGEAAIVTTGAPLPANADVVVMHEKTTFRGDELTIQDQPLPPGMNRLPRGSVYRSGDLLLPGGVDLDPVRIGLLAAAGAASVRVHDRPRVAVVPTGDELVDFSKAPGPHQIRNSNAPMLQALLSRQGSKTWVSPILPDEPEPLHEGLGRALASDVILVIGGVSAGRLDLVPSTLKALGVREVFHKVRLKPGKPLWFGVGPDRDDRPPALVFGLPGNPLSGLVNFLLFVAPALEILEGRPPRSPRIIPAQSAAPLHHRGDLETYLPARIVEDAGEPSGHPTVEPLESRGSADMATVARADGFLVLPGRDATVEAGEIVGFLPFH